jgi:hypothetical protein
MLAVLETSSTSPLTTAVNATIGTLLPSELAWRMARAASMPLITGI